MVACQFKQVISMVDKAKQFLYKIQSRNQLRQVLNEKREIYAEMVQHPECLEETLILKSEISAIELELGIFRNDD